MRQPDPQLLAQVWAQLPTSRANAVTARQLAALFGTHTRRIGEIVSALVASGIPVCSTSSSGIWIASDPADVDASLAEVEKRARQMLRKRRFLRAVRNELLGQSRLHGGERMP